jgi:hypothetical protein
MKAPVRDSSSFVFDASAKTVTFSAPVPASQASILGILNVTNNAWLYLPVKTGYGGTWATPVLTLAASTTGHANTDSLQIFYDDGVSSDLGIGTDGSSAPTLPGGSSGVRGWLRQLWSGLGSQGDTAASADSGSFSLLSLMQRLLGHVAGLRTISTTGTLAALNDTVTLNLNGQTQTYIAVSGTWAGTIQFELQTDSGWVIASTVVYGSGTTSSTATSTSINTYRVVYTGTASAVRVVATSWTSGTATIILRAGQGIAMAPVAITGIVSTSGPSSRSTSASVSLYQAGYRGATAPPTAVTNGQGVDQLATTYGVAIVRPWSIPELCWLYAAASGGITNTTDVAIASAAGAGLRRYLVRLTLSNNSATATEVVIKDGSTVIARLHMAANTGNVPFMFDPPLSTTANTALNVACITTGAAVYANAQGFTSP